MEILWYATGTFPLVEIKTQTQWWGDKTHKQTLWKIRYGLICFSSRHANTMRIAPLWSESVRTIYVIYIIWIWWSGEDMLRLYCIGQKRMAQRHKINNWKVFSRKKACPQSAVLLIRSKSFTFSERNEQKWWYEDEMLNHLVSEWMRRLTSQQHCVVQPVRPRQPPIRCVTAKPEAPLELSFSSTASRIRAVSPHDGSCSQYRRRTRHLGFHFHASEARSVRHATITWLSLERRAAQLIFSETWTTARKKSQNSRLPLSTARVYITAAIFNPWLQSVSTPDWIVP